MFLKYKKFVEERKTHFRNVLKKFSLEYQIQFAFDIAIKKFSLKVGKGLGFLGVQTTPWESFDKVLSIQKLRGRYIDSFSQNIRPKIKEMLQRKSTDIFCKTVQG